MICPPHPEQDEIARIGDAWDSAVGLVRRLLVAKGLLKRGLMQQLLTGKRRFREFANTRFVETQIGAILEPVFRPVEWNEEEHYRLASMRRHSAGLFWREPLYGKQIRVKKLHSLRSGDFLISHIQAAYGAMGAVPPEFDGGKVSDMYTILKPKDPAKIDIRFIDYLSQMPRMRHQAYLACNGFFAERLRLNFDPAEFLKQRIRLPETAEEQRRIVETLDAHGREIRLLEEQLKILKKQKRGLMQKLLTGQIRPKA